MLQTKLDEWGKPAWLSLLVLAFLAGWPLGLAVLAYLAGSGRLRAWRAEMPGTWFNLRGPSSGPAWSETLACADAPCTGTGRSLVWPAARAVGPHREGEEP